ncbi:hypothetical protein E1B28_004983 [Marasmius oreades]|uniref:Uncharacterized protein n=1 Tax=Marasmius oreades TaxID=181124 RepID=A0A9P7UZT8_9AGAR|nr:uncharacterized protein E1B28_004983 [Marasmius oreades]KAG7097654.1 hypothetical protein E1B28_004983 [Marasmius oreades]
MPFKETRRIIYTIKWFSNRRRSVRYTTRLWDLHREDSFIRWNYRLRRFEREFSVERIISTAVINGDSSKFTVVSYKGRDAVKAWKKDFQYFSETADARNMQLFGINQSSIPLLIFYGELLPLAHCWDRLGQLGRSYATTLAFRMKCNRSAMWIDPKQGKLICGLEGPDHDMRHVGFLNIKTLPSNVELLQDDACWRYFSQLPLDKEFDRDVIAILHYTSEGTENVSIATSRPYVVSSPDMSVIAVGNGAWTQLGCLASRVVMPDGRTRFLLSQKDSCFQLYSNPISDNECAWLAQSSSVFHKHKISWHEDLSQYKFIKPYIRLRGTFERSEIKRQRRLDGPPIYFLLDPLHLFPVLKMGSAVSPHTWSFDKNGRTPIPHHHCKYLGLPTELKVEELLTSYKYSWPTETYETIHRWQIARGFDPTTTDFARYLGCPIYEATPTESVRFEELSTEEGADEDLSITSCVADKLPRDCRQKSVLRSIWSTLTAPLTYAACEAQISRRS